jgi:hypothetical protein
LWLLEKHCESRRPGEFFYPLRRYIQRRKNANLEYSLIIRLKINEKDLSTLLEKFHPQTLIKHFRLQTLGLQARVKWAGPKD